MQAKGRIRGTPITTDKDTGGSIPPACTNRGGKMDYRQVKAIEQANKKRLLKVAPYLTEDSGIYILTREENGFKYAYVGQAKHILTRLAQHLKGYQHIDLSLKKHGLKSLENPNGWDITAILCQESELDEIEQYYTKEYANIGYQLRNKTAGGQGAGKFEIAETKPRKTYQEGIQQGYNKARKEVAKLFDKNLTYVIQGKINKNKEKAFAKFREFIEGLE